MEVRTRYARTADGVNIAYATLGEGTPVIEAGNIWGDLHLYNNVAIMKRLNDALAASGLCVTLYDLRGMGSSDRTDTGYSLEGRLLDLDAVADATGSETFALFGMAGAVPTAVAYAASRPERVTRLMLANGYVRGHDWYGAVPAMRISAGMFDMAEAEWETYTLAMAHAVMGFTDPETANEMAGAYRSSATATEALVYMRESLEIDVADQLRLIKAPTLVAHLKPLLSGTLKLMREMASTIPDAQFVEAEVGPGSTKVIADFLQGDTKPAAQPAVTPTAFRSVLFTDLVGHTAMMRRLGDDAGRAVLREHEGLVRRVLGEHGGSEVKTMGDGFMASFTSVTRSAECALALQRAFAERNASSEEPLQVRVGLNAGEPIEEDGDLFGETVILASRIAGMAEGGEVLASVAVRELCAGKGFDFADLGEHVMRGFEDPVRVFEIKWRD